MTKDKKLISYDEFLKAKIKNVEESGFNIQREKLNQKLFPFQADIVQKALQKGRYALFEDCGLGKTLQQLEWGYQIVKKTNKPILILCPLAVAGQTIEEGEKFNIEVERFTGKTKAGIYITNYEQLENIDCSKFTGIVLDESSILKNFEGKIKNKILTDFSNTPYKLACTATPSPNDPMELGNHSEFLNIMSRNEMLSMYFVHDGGETAKWRIKGHSVNKFWDFISSWAVMLTKPSDLGYEDEGYDLPPLNLIEEKIFTEQRDNGLLFNDVAVSATNFNQELRLTREKRLNRTAEIANSSKENFIIWIKQNEEGEYLRKLIPDAIEVKGSDSPEYKEEKLLGFAHNKFRVLITKTKIAQFGLNYQNCNNQIFASLDFSFEGLYQAIRRSYRFGQTKPVNVYMITTDTMSNVIQSIHQKQKNFMEMQRQMTKTIREHTKELKKDSAINNEVKAKDFILYLGDCVKETKKVNTESVHFSIFSPPFAELYTYSDKIEDMGNAKNYSEFFDHFKFLIPELYRILLPGRNIAIHCMDLPIQKGKEGYIGLRDFSGKLIDSFQQNGFIYHSRVTLWKDPVIEMQRTKALGLLHRQLKKDSSMSRVGIPDYLLIFRKEGENPIPISNEKIPVDLWQKYASPVWMDINYSNTLQFRTAREDKDEKHICPLQLDTIERAILLWTNEGEVVFTPFAGIGSEVYQALKMNRRGIGIELKESYYNHAVNNCLSAEKEKLQLDAFAMKEVV